MRLIITELEVLVRARTPGLEGSMSPREPSFFKQVIYRSYRIECTSEAGEIAVKGSDVRVHHFN